MYRFVRAIVWLLTLPPMGVLYLVARLFYFLLYYIVGYRKKVVRDNLRKSFPEKDEKELLSIEKKCYRFFCEMFIESFKSLHISADEMRRRVVYENLELMEEEFSKGKSIIMISGHYMNWEWSTSVLLHYAGNFSDYSIYQKLSSPTFDKLMNEIRSKFGCITLERGQIIRKMLENKKLGKVSCYGMVGDQSPAKANIRYWMNFLNQDTPVFLGAEQLAQKFDLSIVYFDMEQIKRGYYKITIRPVTLNAESEDPYAITERYMKMVEDSIRRQPENWLWTHKRWKHTRNEQN